MDAHMMGHPSLLSRPERHHDTPPQVEDNSFAVPLSAPRPPSAPPQILPSTYQPKAFRSVGKLNHLVVPLDLSQPRAFEQLVRTRSYRGEIILFLANPKMAGWTFNFVKQLRDAGYEHWFILSDSAQSCSALSTLWAPMQALHGEPPLSCAWSAYPQNHSGWKRWGANPLYPMWNTRWWVSLQLLRARVSVLSLDIDAALRKDVYADLRSPPLSHHDVVVTRHSDDRHEINCGFVYFNLHPEPRPPGAQPPPRSCAPQPATPPPSPPSPPLLSAEAEAVALAQREMSTAATVAAEGGAAAPMGAAEWACNVLWERLLGLLEVDPNQWKAEQRPAAKVLWEQANWNDVVKSLEERRKVYPVVAGMAKRSPLWQALGYVPHERNKTIGFASEPLSRAIDIPAEAHADAFATEVLRPPLLTLLLCAPYDAAAAQRLARAELDGAQERRGLPLTIAAAAGRAMRDGSLVIAPTWLASLSGEPDDSWIGAAPPFTAYVHLTSVWRCFPHPCWSHTGRLFTARVSGLWDERLDALNVTPSGRPFEIASGAAGQSPETMRALVLPAPLLAALPAAVQHAPARQKPSRPGGSSALQPLHEGEHDEPSRAARATHAALGFKRLHMVLHNLARTTYRPRACACAAHDIHTCTYMCMCMCMCMHM